MAIRPLPRGVATFGVDNYYYSAHVIRFSYPTFWSKLDLFAARNIIWLCKKIDLTHECCPKHMYVGTAGLKEYKETNEEGKQKMESKAETKKI